MKRFLNFQTFLITLLGASVVVSAVQRPTVLRFVCVGLVAAMFALTWLRNTRL